MSADPSIDPSLARSAVDAAFGPQHSHLQPQELFYDATDDPTAFQLANAAIQGTEVSAIAAAAAVAAGILPESEDDPQSGKKSSTKPKRTGPLIRKRSGWNAFYKEQFAIYHASNPPATKQNARERKGFSSYAAGEWKKLSPAEKEAYVQRASEDDALAVSRPVEKLRRKRVGLLDTLGRIVAELESGDADLERAVDVYRRGALLKAHCDAKLKAAQLKVEKIIQGPSGAVGVEPAEFA